MFPPLAVAAFIGALAILLAGTGMVHLVLLLWWNLMPWHLP